MTFKLKNKMGSVLIIPTDLPSIRNVLLLEAAPIRWSCQHPFQASRLCEQWRWSWLIHLWHVWWLTRPIRASSWKAHILQQPTTIRPEIIWFWSEGQESHSYDGWKARYVQQESESLRWQIQKRNEPCCKLPNDARLTSVRTESDTARS